MFIAFVKKSKAVVCVLPPCEVWATAWRNSHQRKIPKPAPLEVTANSDRSPAGEALVPETTREPQNQRSLFGEILDWMLVPLLLLWPISIGVTYLIAKSIANEPFDRALEDRVTVVAQQVKEVDGEVSVELPYAARDILRADDVDNVYFQIRGAQHQMVSGDVDIPLPDEEDKPVPWSVVLRDAQMRNADVRIASVYVNLQPARNGRPESEGPRYALVQVAETLEKRHQLTNQIIKGVILPEFIILPIALTLLWFALVRGLSPLTALQDHIRSRRPDDLSPIDSHAVPEEISPLVRSLNDMLARLSQSIHSQKRFIADAAHQMKTPLAGMRMQSELAMRQSNREEIQRSLEQLSKSSESATRLVNQLLALARAENDSPQATSLDLIDLRPLVQDTVRDWFQSALARQIDLGFEEDEIALPVRGNATMLREMLNNLIDNALRYTQLGGRVTVRIRADQEHALALLEVEDNGPGIAAAERTRVFERFYRILGSEVEGSGLGLSIVREIAQRHQADIDLFSNPRATDPRFPGLLVRIRLPMVSTTASTTASTIASSVSLH
jgi:two-component system sensor histidine kinase TctE